MYIDMSKEKDVRAIAALVNIDAKVAEVLAQEEEPAAQTATPSAATEHWPPLQLPRVGAPPAFPPGALPQWLAEFAEGLAEAKQVAVDGPAMLSLAMLGAAAAKRVRVRVWGDEVHPLNLWVLLVMPTGEGKSPIMSALAGVFERHQQRLIYEGRTEDERNRTARKVAEQRCRIAVRRAAQAENEEERADLLEHARQLDVALQALAPKPEPRVLTDDCTPEALVQMLAENNGSLALVSDEGSSLFQNVMRRSIEGVDSIEALLKAHSATTLIVNRISRSSLLIHEPALSIAIATQGRTFQKLARRDGFLGRGLWERFLVVMSPSRVGRRAAMPTQVERWIEGQYAGTIGSLLALRVADAAERVPTLDLGAEARDVIATFVEEIDRRMAPHADLGSEVIAGWANKVRTNVIRLTAILALADRGVPESHEGFATLISGTHAVQAVSIMRYALSQAIAAFGAVQATPDDVQVALHWLRAWEKPAFDRRDLQYARSASFPRAEYVQPVLDALVAISAIRPVAPVRGGRGRPARARYEIHPELRMTK